MKHTVFVYDFFLDYLNTQIHSINFFRRCVNDYSIGLADIKKVSFTNYNAHLNANQLVVKLLQKLFELVNGCNRLLFRQLA